MTTLLSSNRLGNPFRAARRERLAKNIEQHVPFYVRMQISSYEARVAALLSAMVTAQREGAPHYYAFFCSSTSESISGALKVVRHNLHAKNPAAEKTTLVYDQSQSLEEVFDPFHAGPDEALVPGLVYCADATTFENRLREGVPPSIMLRGGESLPQEAIERLLAFASSQGSLTILDETTTDLAEGPLAARLAVFPDVIVFGENLGNEQVPTGCFLIREKLFEVWNSGKDYNIHSNTWGGNSASLSTVLDYLHSIPAYRQLPAKVADEIESVVDSHAAVTAMYQKSCSPKMAAMLNLGGLNKNIRSAQRASVVIAAGKGTRTVIDASGTYGVNLRGHNPHEVLASVLQCHDEAHDYWQDLEQQLATLTGLAHVLPAVSGATSTEAALTMGLLAAAPKKTIVAMKGGFSGKTLLSLISTSRERFKLPFQPLYRHVQYIDPFGGEGPSQLRDLCAAGDVATVILETVQGEGGVRAIPPQMLAALAQYREQYGYSIIVDEVQTGMYRTGCFLNYQGKLPQVDIVAMGKGMSGNVFPVSACLVSDKVYQRAREQNEALVQRYTQQYRCQFGAHIALDSIIAGKELRLADHARELGAHFLERLRGSTADLAFVKEVRGEGLMVGIEFDPAKLPGLIRDSFGGLIASRCINDPQQPILTAYNPDKPFLIRFVPPLCITREEIDAVVETMNRALRAGIAGLLKPVVVNLIKSKLGRY